MTELLYAVSLAMLSLYTWGYVDQNVPFRHIPFLSQFAYGHGAVSGLFYAGMVILLFFWYRYVLRGVTRRTFDGARIVRIIGITVLVLFLSYPAFSNDIYNYMATARVTFLYRENPYLVMPIDIPNEPMLSFMHAANKTALYGPSWILTTYVPYLLGRGNLLMTMYAFKLVAAVSYLALAWLIRRLTHSTWAVAFFALNPLVVVDTLIDAHNDAFMMALALGAFYLLMRKRYGISVLLLIFSMLVKGATVFLVPVYIYAWTHGFGNETVRQRIWTWSLVSMFLIFLLSPLREEIYSWYFVWVLAFAAMRKPFDWLGAAVMGFTLGLPLRFLPYAVTMNWAGATPTVKEIVTFVPPLASGIAYALWRKGKHGST